MEDCNAEGRWIPMNPPRKETAGEAEAEHLREREQMLDVSDRNCAASKYSSTKTEKTCCTDMLSVAACKHKHAQFGDIHSWARSWHDLFCTWSAGKTLVFQY